LPHDDDPPEQRVEAPPGIPGPVTFAPLVGNAARLYGRRFLPLFAASVVVYAVAVGIGLAFGSLDGGAATAATIGLRIVLGVGAAFAMAFMTIVVADVIVGRATNYKDVFATLRVHVRELIMAGLLATLIGLSLDLIVPYMSLVFVGPPIVVQVIALEYRSFTESLGRTAELLRGQSLRTVLYIAGLAVGMLVLFYTFLIYVLPLVLPFFAAATVVLYLDLRARNEELDLEGFAREREDAIGDRRAADPIQD
jgi:hypothetical protein